MRARRSWSCAVSGVVAGILLLPSLGCGAEPEASVARGSWSFSTETMGTLATLQLAGADSTALADLAYRALLRFHHADSLLSNWSEDSELSRVNRAAGHGWTDLGPELLQVLQTALLVAQESEGAFDPTVEPLVRLWGFLGGTPHLPPESEIAQRMERVGWQKVELEASVGRVHFDAPEVRLDLGGIAKGYAVDEVAALLDSAGVTDYLVDLSGNMAARGGPPPRDAWRIGVRDPADRLPHLGLLTLDAGTLASSGDYEQFVDVSGKRFGHILDPRTGYPAEGLLGVTVLAPSAELADAWATALFVLGPAEARAECRRRDELSGILVEGHEGGGATVWVEESLRDRFHPHPELERIARLRWF